MNEGSARSARLVQALYRLVKACLLHGDANQVVTSLAPEVARAVADLCALRESASARILVADDAVFVDRRMLKGSREVSAMGLELGTLLDRCGVNEVTLERQVTPEALIRLARLLANAQREREAIQRAPEGLPAGITARRVSLAEAEVLPELEESTTARVVREYAAAVVHMQRFQAELEAGGSPRANPVKRMAQKLLGLEERDPQLLVTLAASRFPDADPARIAVSTAVLATTAARQITSDDTALSGLAMAALVADAGRARLGGLGDAAKLPQSALAALVGLGDLNPGSLARSVIAYETLRLEHGAEGAAATALGRILHLARRLNALRTPSGSETSPPVGLDVAAEVLRREARSELERACVDLLIAGLGFYPFGSLVELTTDEVAIVVGAPVLAVDFARPPVRVLADPPVDIDLAARPDPGAPARAIRRVLEASPEQLGTARRLAAPAG